VPKNDNKFTFKFKRLAVVSSLVYKETAFILELSTAA